MIRTMFECPETGKPLLSTVTVDLWPGSDEELVSRHCPKCGNLHRFHAADAILLMEDERLPRAAGGRFSRADGALAG